MLDWLPAALPVSCGAYGLELVTIDPEGVRLRFFGLERFRGDPERAPFVVEAGFGAIDDPRFDTAVRAWLVVVREALTFADSWPRASDAWLGPLDVMSTHLFEKVLKKKSLREEAQLIAVWRELLRDFLPPPPALLEAIEVLDGVLREDPVIARTATMALEAVPNDRDRFAFQRRGAVVTLRLIVWDSEGGPIRDIKEQECVLLEGGDLAPERVRAFVAAWREALAEKLNALGFEVDTMMPHDLVPTGVLELVRPHTKDEFLAVLRKRFA